MSSAAAASSSSAAAGAAALSSYLSAEQLAQFDRDGYLILPNFFSADTAVSLKKHVDELVAGLDLSTHPKVVFKSATGGTQTNAPASEDKNTYFLDSADRVSFFFEADAFDAEGKLIAPREASINKIGHALHVLDEPFARFTHRPEVKALAKDIGMRDPIVLQSMCILKQPRIGGVVAPHRDSSFLFTEPSTATGLWFALEDCTSTNGCLSFVPGSHKDGANSKRFRRQASATAPLVPSINNPEWAAATPASSQSGPHNSGVELAFEGTDSGLDGGLYPESAFIPAEVKAGTLVLIHGEVVHASTHNHSDKSRYIYTFHLIDQQGTTYPMTNCQHTIAGARKAGLQSSKRFPKLNDH